MDRDAYRIIYWYTFAYERVTEEVLIQRRMPHWNRLAELTAQADASMRKLTPSDFTEFVRLYRQASGDLAFLRTRPTNDDVLVYLNGVVGRAYALLYRAERKPFWTAVSEGIATGVQTVRRRSGYIWACGLLFFAGAIAAYFAMSFNPEVRSVLIPPEMEENTRAWVEGEIGDRSGGESIAMSFFYASNNPMVGIQSVGMGLASFGLMTIYMMWMNGLMLGSLGHEMAEVGRLAHLITWIAPHGISEMGGIFVTGASGLVLGGALVRPGRRTRGEALRIAGKDAFSLLAVGLAMIFAAAPIEGFFSFNSQVPDAAKILVAAMSLVAYWAFFSFFGRESSATDEPWTAQPGLPGSAHTLPDESDSAL